MTFYGIIRNLILVFERQVSNEKWKKILFVSSYSGSSAYIYSLIKGGFPFSYKLIVDKVGQDLFNDKRIAVDYNFNNDNLSPEEIVKKESPDAIFVVSQWSPNIEKDFIKVGRKHLIPTISAIENWLCYLERFSETDGVEIVSENVYLPDYIIVNDNIARTEAIQKGLPSDKIHTFGNPLLEDLSNKKLMPLPKEEWLKNLDLSKDKKVITFISEDYSNDFSKSSKFYQGFDEYEVLEDILSVIKDNFNLLVKLHPAEENDKYIRYENLKFLKVVKKTEMDSLFAYSDFIIGMGTILLVEASFFRNDVISYRPNEQVDFYGNRTGLTFAAKNKHELQQILYGEKIVTNLRPNEKYKGSREKIINFIKEII